MERKTSHPVPLSLFAPQPAARPLWKSLGPEIAVLFFAASIRLELLFLRPLYTDEVFEAREVVALPFKDIFLNFRPDFHLLHALSAKLMGLVGWEPALLRWPSLLAGILAVALLYRFARSLFGRTIALYSALLFSVLPAAITSSVEIRGYSFMILFCLLANISLWRALESKRTSDWLIFSLAVIAAIYSHLFAVLILVPSALFIFVQLAMRDGVRFSHKSPLWRQAGAAYAFIGLATLANLALIGQSKLNMVRLGQINELGCENDFAGFQPSQPLAIFGGFMEHLRLGNFSSEQNGLLILFGLLVIAGIIIVLSSPATRRQGVYLLLLILSPMIFMLLLQSLPFSDLRVCARYMDFSIPAYTILIAVVLIFFSRLLGRIAPFFGHSASWILLLVLIAPAYNTLKPFITEGGSEQMVRAAHFVSADFQPDDLIFCVQRDQNETRIIRDRCILTFHFYPQLAKNTYSWQAMQSSMNWQEMLLPHTRCDAQYHYNNEEGYELIQSCAAGTPKGKRVWLVYWQRESSTAIKLLQPRDTQAHFGNTQLVKVDSSPELTRNITSASTLILADGVGPGRWQENAFHAVNLDLALGRIEEAKDLLKDIIQINATPREMEIAQKARDLIPWLPFLESSPAPQFSSRAVWNEEIGLLGYSFSEPENVKDNKISTKITLFWDALEPISKDYTFFLQCRDESGANLAQLDFQTYDGGLPTSRWKPGDVIRESRSWQMAAPAAGKPCRVLLGIYDLQTMKRLPLANDVSGENALELTRNR